jgi:hypothetical protein
MDGVLLPDAILKKLHEMFARTVHELIYIDQETTDEGGGQRRGPYCGRIILLPGRLILP